MQITDTHLGRQEGEKLLGIDTDYSLQAVLEQLAQERSAPELIIVTGDVSNNGYRAAYDRLLQSVKRFSSRCVWLPGNHDETALMRDRGAEQLVHRVDLESWQVLLLDSSVPNRVGGSISSDQLALLRRSLSEHPEQYSVVCLHHHVLPVGCAWLDEQRVDNAADFFDVLADFPRVRLVMSGHVHQETDVVHRGIRVLTSPSTCVQFAPGSRDFAVDLSSPGYRWLELHADGRIDTGVSRVRDVSFDVDTRARGY